MQALETITDITDHRLVVESPTLPARAKGARVIVLWDSPSASSRRVPPPALAGLGREKGGILSGPPESDWEALG